MSVGHAQYLELRNLSFKLSVPGGDSTREYVRRLDMLIQRLYDMCHYYYQHGSAAKMWKQGNVEIRVLYVALWKHRQAHGNVN